MRALELRDSEKEPWLCIIGETKKENKSLITYNYVICHHYILILKIQILLGFVKIAKKSDFIEDDVKDLGGVLEGSLNMYHDILTMDYKFDLC